MKLTKDTLIEGQIVKKGTSVVLKETDFSLEKVLNLLDAYALDYEGGATRFEHNKEFKRGFNRFGFRYKGIRVALCNRTENTASITIYKESPVYYYFDDEDFNYFLKDIKLSGIELDTFA